MNTVQSQIQKTNKQRVHILLNWVASHKQVCVKARFLHWSCVMLSAHASDETHLVVWYLGEAIIGKGGFILVAPQLGFSMADHSNLFYFFFRAFHFICLEHCPGANVNQKWLTVHQQLYTKKCLKKSFNVVCIVNKQKTEGFHSIRIDIPSCGQVLFEKAYRGPARKPKRTLASFWTLRRSSNIARIANAVQCHN